MADSYTATRRYQRGFTVVELVVVIVILSITSLVTVQFIANMATGYVDMTRRQNMTDVTQLAIERMSRELRNALPNSVRVRSNTNATCLEFIPALAASTYQDVPVMVADNQFTAIPLGASFVSTWSTSATLYAAVYPISSNRTDEIHTENPIYDLDNHAIMAQLASTSGFINDQGATSVITVNLANNHRFVSFSPSSRFFIARSPVSFCLDETSGRLYRYSNYLNGGVFYTQQPMLGSLPTSEPNRVIVASGLSSSAPFSNPAFAYFENALQRNGLVLIDLQVEEGGESVRIQHAIQVRNAP